MKHELWDIREEENTQYPLWCWRAQSVNYVARFLTRAAAEKFVEATKIYREKQGFK